MTLSLEFWLVIVISPPPHTPPFNACLMIVNCILVVMHFICDVSSSGVTFSVTKCVDKIPNRLDNKKHYINSIYNVVQATHFVVCIMQE